MLEKLDTLIVALTDGVKQMSRYRTARGTRMNVNYVYDSMNLGRITAHDVATVTMLDEVDSQRIAGDMNAAGTNTANVTEFAVKRGGFTHPLIVTILVLGILSALFLLVIFGPPMLFLYGVVALVVAPFYARNRWEKINTYTLSPGVTLSDQTPESIEALETRVYTEAMENDPSMQDAGDLVDEDEVAEDDTYEDAYEDEMYATRSEA